MGFKENLVKSYQSTKVLHDDIKTQNNKVNHEMLMMVAHGLTSAGLIVSTFTFTSLGALFAPLSVGIGLGWIGHYSGSHLH